MAACIYPAEVGAVTTRQCEGIKRSVVRLFSSRVNGTYPTQYMSGGFAVQLSQGRRLSFGVCPFTLYVPRKKL